MSNQNAFQPDYAVSPGEVLDEHREAAAMTQMELAQRLGFTTKHVNRLLAGLEPVTPETALKLETVFGLPARLWLGLEARYREHLANMESDPDTWPPADRRPAHPHSKLIASLVRSRPQPKEKP